MKSIKQLGIAFIVVFVAVLVDCGFMYYQASTGSRLPFKISIFPKYDGEIK